MDSENARFSYKISCCRTKCIYAISKQEIEQPVSPFDFIFLMFPMKVVEDHAHSNRRKSSAPALIDSHGKWMTCYANM